MIPRLEPWIDTQTSTLPSLKHPTTQSKWNLIPWFSRSAVILIITVCTNQSLQFISKAPKRTKPSRHSILQSTVANSPFTVHHLYSFSRSRGDGHLPTHLLAIHPFRRPLRRWSPRRRSRIQLLYLRSRPRPIWNRRRQPNHQLLDQRYSSRSNERDSPGSIRVRSSPPPLAYKLKAS